jgi:hypothetical protein
MRNNIENISIENQPGMIWQKPSAVLQFNSNHSDTIHQKPSGVLQNFKFRWSHHYPSKYCLYLPDKKILQRKLTEWLNEFENIDDK